MASTVLIPGSVSAAEATPPKDSQASSTDTSSVSNAQQAPELPMPSTSQSRPQPCGTSLNPSGRQPLRDVKSANFYIAFPPGLRWALECRGREEECAKQRLQPHAVDANTFIPREIGRLKDLSSGYPQALYPDHLAEVLRPLFKTAIAPLLQHSVSGQPPEPTMLSPYSESYACTAATPDVVNLIITVSLVDNTTPHIVVLTRSIYRHGNETYFPPDSPFSTAIPLDLPEEETKKRVTVFMQQVVNYFYALTASARGVQ